MLNDGEMFVVYCQFLLTTGMGEAMDTIKTHRKIAKKAGNNVSGKIVAGDAGIEGILDTLPMTIAVLDETGRIIMVNREWKRFGLSNGLTAPDSAGFGANYIDICRKAERSGNIYARDTIRGLTDLIDGRVSEFALEYPCDSPDERRWFLMWATPFNDNKIVIMHLDITGRKIAEQALQAAHDELEQRVRERTAELTRANELLKEEIDQRSQVEEKLRQALREIGQYRLQLEADYSYLREEIRSQHNFSEIIGRSDSLKSVLLKVEQIAHTDTTVLILGETGTGKELIARAVHNGSSRSRRPLVKVNCAALPANLIESELFGHERGAFTGAWARQTGRFELANGGTILLDEIGELPPELQPKLLRVLQDREFERLGGTQTLKTDARVITATNRNLETEVQEGRFRKDLYYRINIFPITIPPLRDRREDIAPLVRAFIEKCAKKLGKRIKMIPQKTMKALEGYSWPGNIRELENVIERAVISSPSSVLELVDNLSGPEFRADGPVDQKIEEVERTHIIGILDRTRWKVEGKAGAAAILGLNPSTLRGRMRKLGISRPWK